jgi:hypothetical protein
MSTRRPRNGTPSASSSARCGAPCASDPSACTIRCHGTLGSWQSWRTAPATRGAPGETSPYVRTKPAGVARTRARIRRVRSTSTSAAYGPSVGLWWGWWVVAGLVASWWRAWRRAAHFASRDPEGALHVNVTINPFRRRRVTLTWWEQVNVTTPARPGIDCHVDVHGTRPGARRAATSPPPAPPAPPNARAPHTPATPPPAPRPNPTQTPPNHPDMVAHA